MCTNIRVGSSALRRRYLDTGAHCVDGEVGEQTQALSEGGHEEGEDELPSLVREPLVDKPGNALVALVVDCDVNEGGDEGGGEAELDAPKELEAVVLDGGEGEGDGVMIDVFAGLEAGGYGINGVQECVADPVPAR